MDDIALRKKTRSVQVSGTSRPQRSEDVEKLKSQVRSCVTRILTERLSTPSELPKIDNTDNLLVAELIVEYLEWMGYNQTLDIFRKECCLPEERNAVDLSLELGCTNETVLPRIFQVINKFKESLERN